jgi:hypothetical protein
MSTDRGTQVSGGFGARCRRDMAFLPSEAATVGLVLWVAARFYPAASFPLSVWFGAMGAWIAVACGLAAWERRAKGDLGPIYVLAAHAFRWALVVWITRTWAGNLNWSQALAIGVMLLLSLAFNRWLLGLAANHRTIGLGEGVRWASIQIIAVCAIHPYARAADVGAGDAYHYTLMLADFIGQLRAGIFPVYVGQTDYAFNGGIHTLRTAPYYVHFGGLLDVLTVHTLPVYALTNLCLVISAAAGGVGMYAALRRYAPGRTWSALALGGLYILAPAILAPLYEGDMVATFMTVPILPWLVLGLALAAGDGAAWRPWILQALALSALWWAHPPIAFWACILALGSCAVMLVQRTLTRASMPPVACAFVLLAVLSCYEFVSVHTLLLPPDPNTRANDVASILQNIAHNWRASFEPLNANANNLLGDIQLGYALLAGALAGALALRTRKSAVLLLAAVVGFLLLLAPIPGVSPWLWSRVPQEVLSVTNAWPMQRFYPILAALAVFSAMTGLSRLDPRNRRHTALTALGIAAGLAWSGWEAQKFFTHGALVTATPEKSALLVRPENVTLTRSSYQLFGFFPDYYSDGEMDPALETRLFDARTITEIADGASRTPGSATPSMPTLELHEISDGFMDQDVAVAPGANDVLRFDFLGRERAGRLILSSRTLLRDYALPSSGREKSFGSGPQNGRLIAIRNTGSQPERVSLRYLHVDPQPDGKSPSPAFARVTIDDDRDGGHVIDLLSLMPYHVVVQSDRESVLETPKIKIPGYRALVNGRGVEILKTANGCVGVPLHEGTSDVRIDYPGSPLLRGSYALSATCWLGVFAVVWVRSLAGAPSRPSPRRTALVGSLSRALRKWVLPFAAGVALVLTAREIWMRFAMPQPGVRKMVVMLPWGRTGQNEPLLTTGQTGAGDVIYISYLGGNRVSVGYDKWGQTATVSAPFEADFARPQTVEVAMKSLSAHGWWGPEPAEKAPPLVSVKWEGRDVISAPKDSYPPGPRGVEVGANDIGASTCGPLFTGDILEGGD